MLQKMSRLAHDISYSYFSTMACSRGMKEAARWQFCKNTQRPFRIWAFEISSSALGPWSRPREIISRCKALPLSSSANLTNCARGSVPIMKQCWIFYLTCTTVAAVHYIKKKNHKWILEIKDIIFYFWKIDSQIQAMTHAYLVIGWIWEEF